MTLHKNYLDGSPIVRSGGSNAAGFPKVTIFENTFDATRRPCAATDVVELINIPAGTYVMKVFVHVLNGEADQTLNVGDGTDVDGWVAAQAVATTGTRAMGAGDYAKDAQNALIGKFYATADTIDLEVPADKAYATLRVRVVALCVGIG
jgi:hypothetical protein